MILYEHIMLYMFSFFGLFTSIFFLLIFLENRSALKHIVLTNFPKVTVGIPVYNNPECLKKTVNSVLELDYPKNKLQIIIVDDGSTDESARIADAFKKQGVKVIHQKGKGKSGALNTALQYANGEFFACLDVDSYVSPDCLKKMLGYFENDDVMAVTPSLKVTHAKTILQKIQMIEFLLGVYLRHIFGCLGSIHVTPGPFTVYRVLFFKKTGGYAEKNLTEDIEMALRIQSKNYIIENCISASVYTEGVAKFCPLLKQRLRWYKGFFDNVMDYRFLFGKKHGNLGLFILPASFISIFAIITLCTYALVKFLQNMSLKISQLIAINFDILPMLQLKFDPFYISANAIYILGILSMIIGIFGILVAKSYSQERQNIKLAYIYFFFGYGFLFAFWWIVAFYYKISNKKIRWGNKYL